MSPQRASLSFCAALFFATTITACAADYGTLPLSFEPNAGQAGTRVQFLSRGQGGTLFLTSTEAVLQANGDFLRMQIERANPRARGEAVEPQIGKSNYFIGNNPAQWRTGVPHYGRVQFAGVYPGIDLAYYGRNGRLEYDWIVKPGADPSKILLRFDGARKMRVDSNGDLVLETASGEVREKKPVVYQKPGQAIAGRYVLRGRREAAFEIGPYDRARELVIDPVLVYESYLGGLTGSTYGTGIAADSAGNAYLTGYTLATDFPLVNAFETTNPPSKHSDDPNEDAFVTKVSADGSTLLYSTYLGGTGADMGNAIAVDASGNAYVTGTTSATDFPLVNPFQNKNLAGIGNNVFVTKLNPSGNALVFSTYFGGTGGGDGGNGIALDSARNVYIGGYTNSSNFPLQNPIQTDSGTNNLGAFVTKMSADGQSLVYSTYVGGTISGIAVDASGAAYVTGWTSLTKMLTVNPFQSTNNSTGTTAFVAKINPSGSAFAYSTYLGGSQLDKAYSIAVDSSGSAYVTGTTRSSDFPTTANALQGPMSGGAAFVSKLSPSGSSLVYSTYLGKPDDTGFGIAVNGAGEAWVTGNGHPASVNPVPHGTVNPSFFVSHLNAAGNSFLFSSPLAITSAIQGAIALDSSGNAYITGVVGGTAFSNPSGFQTTSDESLQYAAAIKIANGPALPSISAVVNGASFAPGLVVGSWATIQGGSLATGTGTWIVVNGQLPTSVNQTSVTVGGLPAYVYYVSPGQINFIVPAVGAGTQPVVVMNAAGSSSPVNAMVTAFGPAFFEWPNNQAVATRQDFSLAAANGTFAGATTVPAKPGDTIILWGTGFGSTSPAFPQGQVTPSSATYDTASLPMVTVNNISATVYGAALAPGFAGLYQIAIQVPSSLSNGNWPVVATIGGASSPATTMLTVQQ